MATNEVQKADHKARRLALVFILIGMIVGALLILAVEQYQGTIRDRILSEPTGASDRIRLAFLVSAALLSTPLLLFAAYCWTLGAKVRRAQRFPPPNVRVIRDTSVVYGYDAVFRARGAASPGCGFADPHHAPVGGILVFRRHPEWASSLTTYQANERCGNGMRREPCLTEIP
jgi:hypothetical protein